MQSEDGWLSNADISQHQQQFYPSCSNKFNEPRQILKTPYSLEPDILTGWRPKLPHGPIALAYPNTMLQELINVIQHDDRYQLAFTSHCAYNSALMNLQNNYHWADRDKFTMPIASVQSAISLVGRNTYHKVPAEICQFTFQDNFQCANLALAVRVKPNEYDCFIRADTNAYQQTNSSQKHIFDSNIWYYFKVKNHRNIGTLKLNICDLPIPTHLGKKLYPLIRFENGQWGQQRCYEINYFERYCRYGINRKYKQLQFKIDFNSQNKSVYIAHSRPYSYGQLQQYIQTLKIDSRVKYQTLGKSIGGLSIPLLVISGNNYHNTDKKNIVILGRTNASECISSFMIQGIVTSALTNKKSTLLSDCTLYIIPMLNPDGVIAGNSQTNYAGLSLNECMSLKNQYILPQLYAFKQFCCSMDRIDIFLHINAKFQTSNLCLTQLLPLTHQSHMKNKVFVKTLQKNNWNYQYHNKNSNAVSVYMFEKMKIWLSLQLLISSINPDYNSVDLNECISKSAKQLIVTISKYMLWQAIINKYKLKLKLNRNNMKVIQKKRPLKNLAQISNKSSIISQNKSMTIKLNDRPEKNVELQRRNTELDNSSNNEPQLCNLILEVLQEEEQNPILQKEDRIYNTNYRAMPCQKSRQLYQEIVCAKKCNILGQPIIQNQQDRKNDSIDTIFYKLSKYAKQYNKRQKQTDQSENFTRVTGKNKTKLSRYQKLSPLSPSTRHNTIEYRNYLHL